MAIVANRYRGVRAANCGDVFSARYSRSHHDSNVLTLGGRVLGVGLAWEIVNAWLATIVQRGGDRHMRAAFPRSTHRREVPLLLALGQQSHRLAGVDRRGRDSP